MDPLSGQTPESRPDLTPPPATAKPKFKLSCTLCRARKIKCDRVYPCSHCTRSSSECVFPERKRMQRPRKTKNSELLNRISRLESIVGNVSLEGLKDADLSELKGLVNLKAQVAGKTSPKSQSPANSPSQSPATAREPVGSAGASRSTQSSNKQPSGQEIHPLKYVGGDFWSSLATEVEGLKQALAQSGDSYSEEESEADSPESTHIHRQQTFATQGLLAGYPSPESGALLSHPPRYQINFLVATYFENVDTILKILHRPTILKMVAEGTSKLSTAQEALQFSIYFAAISSLSPATCISQLNQDQATLIKAYQLHLERALAAADYLNNNEIECLQALLLYVGCLRAHNDTRASWVLAAMLLRIAQAQGINRDGDGHRYPPYEAELRRRLWWQVVVLDIRAAEDRGTEAMIDGGSYNTRLPMNLNDDDFGPDSVGPLTERTGPTDVTFSLCTAQASGIFLWLGHAQSRLTTSSSMRNIQEDAAIAKTRTLEHDFIAEYDHTHFQSTLAANLTRMISLKLWLMLHYPIHHPAQSTATETPAPRRPRPPREAILQTALAIIELQMAKGSSVLGWQERFRWWGRTYVQWHPLAVALAELCAQTRGALVERTWRAVETVYPEWAKIVADSKRGALWRPIRKLYRKAKEARAEAVRREREEQGVHAAAMDTLGLLGVDTDAMTDYITGPDAAADALARMQVPLTAGATAEQQQEQHNPTAYASALFFDDSVANTAAATTAAAAPSLSLGLARQQQFGTTEVPIVSPLDSMMDTSSGWQDANFDMLLENPNDQVNWTVWNEFLYDTYNAEGSRAGSSSEDAF